MMTKKRYQPRQMVTNVNAPAATWQVIARSVLPRAALKYDPVSRPKAQTSVRKIKKKQTLVLRAKIM